MGDPRRFDQFAKLINKHINVKAKIADVASGKGYLQAALYQLGYRNVFSWDKRKRNARNHRHFYYSYFEYDKAPRDYEAVVAMHPDEGTDHALMYALHRNIPAIICPCCVRPSAVFWLGKRSFTNWCDHLESLIAPFKRNFEWVSLPINGKSKCLILKE